MKLSEYVKNHIVKDKNGKTNLMFFKVSKKDNPDKEDFLKLVKKEYPHWLDGKEHHYLECGGDMDSQEIALTTMGLGIILEVWDLLTPESIMPFLPQEMKMEMAGRGMISIKIKEAKKWKLK